MKNSIPLFLQEKLNIKGSAQTRFFSQEIKEFMIDYAEYYNWQLGKDLTKIFKVMKMGITDLPKCQYRNCTNHVYLNWELKLTQGCSKNHSQKITYQNKYGVDSNLQLKNTKDKIKKTNITKYGFEYPSLSHIVKDKMKKTNMDRYGVEYATQSALIKQKVIKTNIKKYGVGNPFSSSIIKEKSKFTNLMKYGFEYAMQNSEIYEKSQKKSYRYKDYIWDTGEISRLQGYEDRKSVV